MRRSRFVYWLSEIVLYRACYVVPAGRRRNLIYGLRERLQKIWVRHVGDDT